MFRCLMFFGLSLFFASADAQDDADRQGRINAIVEGTRTLEDQFTFEQCERGDVLACLRLAGLSCEMSGFDLAGTTVCSADGKAIYRLTLDKLRVTQGQMPRKWTIEVLRAQPANNTQQD